MSFYFPRSQKKLVVMVLAVFAITLLLFVTWATGKISFWVVAHDSIGMQMDKEGARLAHLFAEIFLIARDPVLFALEMICGFSFLILLWHTLYRNERENASPRDTAN